METSVYKAKSISDLVLSDHRKVDVLKKYNIDFCCNGKLTITEACERKGIDSSIVEKELLELDKKDDVVREDFSVWKPSELSEHIVSVHHTYVKETIPIIEALLNKLNRVHGKTYPEIPNIYRYFQLFAEELTLHMQKEENILFPYIKELERAYQNDNKISPPSFGTIQNPINLLKAEHKDAGNVLQKLRNLSNNYQAPSYGCNTHKVSFEKLKDFEEDFQLHFHLENNILFPKVVAIEEEILKA